MSQNNQKNRNSSQNKSEAAKNGNNPNGGKQRSENKTQQNTDQNSTARTRRPDGAESALPVLPPFPAQSPVIPGYIDSQQQLEQGGADRGAVKLLKQHSEEHEMG